MTERAKFIFTAKEGANREPYLLLAPAGNDLPILDRGFLSFDLPEGTTINQAEEIAAYLNEKIESVAYTKL